MGGIANMLLGAGAAQPPQQVEDSSLSGLSPEAQAAIKALRAQGQIPEQLAQPGPAPTPATPPAPAAGEPGFLAKFLAMIGLAPPTASLAPQGQPAPAPPTPEELARRNQAISGQ